MIDSFLMNTSFELSSFDLELVLELLLELELFFVIDFWLFSF